MTVANTRENFIHEFLFMELSAKRCPVKISRYTVVTDVKPIIIDSIKIDLD